MGFQRYMRGMNHGRVAQSRNGEPLDNDTLQALVPSIFATEAHESRSKRFAVVPTINVVDGLRDEGFDPFFATQSRTQIEGKEGFTKHMMRFRHRSLENAEGEAFEVIIVNANDGTSAYQMIPGFFRFVCANGLMVGNTFNEVKVRHTGDAVGQVIEGAYSVLGEAPRVCDQVSRFKSLMLREGEQQAYAEAAHVLRFPHAYESDEAKRKPAPITADALLKAVRGEDKGADMWRTFNRVQEQVIRGGQVARVRGQDGRSRRQRVRAVKGIDQGKALNRALWTLAEKMAELKTG